MQGGGVIDGGWGSLAIVRIGNGAIAVNNLHLLAAKNALQQLVVLDYRVVRAVLQLVDLDVHTEPWAIGYTSWCTPSQRSIEAMQTPYTLVKAIGNQQGQLHGRLSTKHRHRLTSDNLPTQGRGVG